MYSLASPWKAWNGISFSFNIALICGSKSSEILCFAKNSIASNTQNGELEVWMLANQQFQHILFYHYNTLAHKIALFHWKHPQLLLYYNSIPFRQSLDIRYYIAPETDKFDFSLSALWTILSFLLFMSFAFRLRIWNKQRIIFLPIYSPSINITIGYFLSRVNLITVIFVIAC